MDWLMIGSIISAIAMVTIAIATALYTHYSKKTLNEIKKQNDYLKKESKEKYVLERKSICKNLLEEININQCNLLDLSMVLNYCLNNNENSKEDQLSLEDYVGWVDNFKFESYKNFLGSKIDFKNDSIKESVAFVYKNIDNLKISLKFWVKRINNKL